MLGQVVYFDGKEDHYERPTIDIVSPKWLTERFISSEYITAKSLNELFEKLGKVCPYGKYVLLTKPGKGHLNNRAVYRKNAKDVAEQFYQIQAGFKEELFTLLLEESVKNGFKPKDYLYHRLGDRSLSPYFAPNRLLALKNDPLWEAYAWAIRSCIGKDSYLNNVFNLGFNNSNFARKYVVEGAVSLLKNDEDELLVNAADVAKRRERLKRLAEERANVIYSFDSLVDSEPLLSEFVKLTQDDDSARVFLNCGSDVEHLESVRRVMGGGILGGTFEKYKGMFPLLDAYLTQEQCYPDDDLEDYFSEYRRLKVCDAVTESFVRRAFDESDKIDNYQSRTLALGEYDSKIEEGLATIVVDAMGAEFLPLLLSEARERNLTVVDYRIVQSNLPTSTEFNEINDKYKPKDIKDWDNVVHYGAVKNETCSPHENLWAGLISFKKVFKEIQSALTFNRYVIVTADHGSTRLAKIAYETRSDLIRSIDPQTDSEPDDWRFERNAHNKTVPDDVIRYFDSATNVTYWVVRGYNRFPKSGGKKNEMHGGATLEEALVPFVVFTNDQESLTLKKDSAEKEKQTPKPIALAQIVEDPDFDI